MNVQYTEPDGVISPPPMPPPDGKEKLSPERQEFLGLPLRRRDSAALLLLALLADICLYRAGGGAGGATLLLAIMATLLALKGKAITARPIKVGVVILALAAMLVWFSWWLAVLVATISIFRLAVGLWRPEWNLLESLWASVKSIFRSPIRLFGHFVACRESSRPSGRRALPARVIGIPIAVSVLFLIVFAAANPVLSRDFSTLWNHIGDFLERLSDYLNMHRLIRPVARSEFIDRLMELTSRLKPCEITQRDEVNFLVAIITLVCVNLVFLGYNCIDAVYLYFKATLPAGITWTAYTHAGCGWLTFALFLSTVVLGFIFWHELNFHARAPLLKRLAFIWIAQNAVLAVGTLRRIYMYIDYSGLTHLLLTGVYGSLLVMAGLLIMTLKIHGNRNAIWLLRRYVSAFAIGLTILALTPIGFVCASYNVPRIQQQKLHAMWPIVLKDLTAEALPPIIPLMDYHRKDGNMAKQKLVREGVAAILGQHLVRLEQEEKRPWTQWQASSWWALKHLRDAREKIYATVPPEQWDIARERLVLDYDLSGAPVRIGITSRMRSRNRVYE